MKKSCDEGGIAVKRMVLIFIIAVVFIFGIFGNMRWKRNFKNFKAETVGLDRVVTVYDYSGGVIRQWDGRILVDGNGDRTKITTSDAKTFIIDGGIVIIEEKK